MSCFTLQPLNVLCLISVACTGAAFLLTKPMKHASVSTRPRFYRDDKPHDTNGESSHLSHSPPKRGALKHDDVIHNSMTPSASSWKRTDELWNQEWHDAFIRNGFIDFTPPLTDFLFCLMIGGDDATGVFSYDPKLPWKSGPLHSAASPVGFLEGFQSLSDETTGRGLRAHTVDGELLHGSHTSLKKGNKNDSKSSSFRYDCILDTSLMNGLVQEHDETYNLGEAVMPSVTFANVGSLLVEANRALQEHGIYVVITKEPMASSPQIKEFLVQAGSAVGMQWQFDMEEISRGGVHVSVARKYFTGHLPSFGKLAKTTTQKETSRQHFQ